MAIFPLGKYDAIPLKSTSNWNIGAFEYKFDTDIYPSVPLQANCGQMLSYAIRFRLSNGIHVTPPNKTNETNETNTKFGQSACFYLHTRSISAYGRSHSLHSFLRLFIPNPITF